MGIAQRIRRRWLHPADPRTPREIEGDIEDELAFHLEQRERELVGRGMSQQAARAEALRRFGDVEQVRAACRRVQTGGRIIMQRVTLVLVVVLLAAIAWLSWANVSSQRIARAEMQAMRANMERLAVELEKRSEPRLGFASGLLPGLNRALQINPPSYSEDGTSAAVWLERIRQSVGAASDEPEPFRWLATGCTPERRGALLDELWPSLDNAQRGALAQALLATGVHSQMFEVAQKLVRDADEALANQGLAFLRKFALVDFRLEQRAECLGWLERNRSRDLDEILAETAPALVARLRRSTEFDADCQRFAELSYRDSEGSAAYYDSARALSTAGGLDVVERWVADPDPRARVAALNWMGGLDLDEVSLRKLVVQLVEDRSPRDPRFLRELGQALSPYSNSWGVGFLLAELERAATASPVEPADVEALLRALAAGDSENVVPRALELMFRADSPELNRLVNTYLLPDLTGVQPDPRHDLEWWKNWWLIHREEFPSTICDPHSGLPAFR